MFPTTCLYPVRRLLRHGISQGDPISFQRCTESPSLISLDRKISDSHAHTTAARQKPEIFIEKLLGTREGIVLLSLNRPEVKNAIGSNFLRLFRETLESLRSERTTRVLVVRSTVTGVFCSGADLKERATMREEEVGPFVASLRGAMLDLYNFPVPTIAAMDGLAVGGGFEMALACDMRAVSSSAKMGLVETKLGIIPGAGGTQFLTRLVGASRAKELIFTGEVFDGAKAHGLGIASYAVEQNTEGDAALNYAVEIAERMLGNGPLALRAAKVAINRGSEVDLSTGLAFEEACYAQIIKTKDRLEGLAAFKEKRKPQFKGE